MLFVLGRCRRSLYLFGLIAIKNVRLASVEAMSVRGTVRESKKIDRIYIYIRLKQVNDQQPLIFIVIVFLSCIRYIQLMDRVFLDEVELIFKVEQHVTSH